MKRFGSSCPADTYARKPPTIVRDDFHSWTVGTRDNLNAPTILSKDMIETSHGGSPMKPVQVELAVHRDRLGPRCGVFEYADDSTQHHCFWLLLLLHAGGLPMRTIASTPARLARAETSP